MKKHQIINLSLRNIQPHSQTHIMQYMKDNSTHYILNVVQIQGILQLADLVKLFLMVRSYVIQNGYRFPRA